MTSTILKVETSSRLSIPNKLLEELGWTKEGITSVECLVVFGATGGIQVAPVDSPLGQQRERLKKLSRPPQSDESDVEWVQLMRFFSALPDVTLHENGRQLRMTIPKEVEELGILKRTEGTKLAVVAIGQILEIWTLEKWKSYQEQLGPMRSRLIDASADDLARRETS